MDRYEFRLHHPSTAIDAQEELRYAEWMSPLHQREGKPVRVWHTQGLNLIGLPQGLINALGTMQIKQAAVFPSVHSAHIETERALYMLRIHSTSRLVFPERTTL